MEHRALVLDANILIRAVLGNRVRRILEAHSDNISFFVPESAYAEAEEHLAALVVKRGGDPVKGLASLRSMAALALGCPIWTEDTDFFGCGVATWTSASIGSFLGQ